MIAGGSQPSARVLYVLLRLMMGGSAEQSDAIGDFLSLIDEEPRLARKVADICDARPDLVQHHPGLRDRAQRAFSPMGRCSG